MGKGKEVMIEPPSSSSHSYGGEEDRDRHHSGSPLSHDVKFSSRNAASKYDFVKVKVCYYVLSRFLLSRMLTVTKIPNHVAVKIALELKKLLVDNSLLDVYVFLPFLIPLHF
ncbi:unnamed protein product [Linum trigynum]|uniref:Uncharacterized protein n=1 Tax=Linum trigynum TaxID=586398 RepID=A0AAV2CER7_9ROSI